MSSAGGRRRDNRLRRDQRQARHIAELRQSGKWRSDPIKTGVRSDSSPTFSGGPMALKSPFLFIGGALLAATLTAQTPLPDLVVRQDMLDSQWVVRVEKLAATACSVIEGDVQPGDRRLVRFTVGTANIGNADINLGDPNAHIAANDGLYEFATCHNHYHFRHYALYELIDPDTGQVWRAAKRGFCMLDTDPNPAWMSGETPAGGPQFLSCGAVGVPGNQGISAGWTDTYRFFLGGQYFVLDGGDGQPVVPPGDYEIRIEVNPAYAPGSGGCPRATDSSTGLCHQIAESNYANNFAAVPVTIPA